MKQQAPYKHGGSDIIRLLCTSESVSWNCSNLQSQLMLLAQKQWFACCCDQIQETDDVLILFLKKRLGNFNKIV